MNSLQLHARTGAPGVARQAHSRSAQHAACSFHGVHRSQPLQRRVDSAFFDGGRKLQLAASSTPRVSRGAVAVEANIFGRVSRVFRSYMNAIVSKAEDPEKILEQAVNDMQGDLIKMRQASAQVMASQKQLDVKYSQAQQTADEWYRRAELALNKGDDDLAREALKRRKAYADNAAQMKAQVDSQRKATDQLISNTRMLEQKLTEAKSKKDTLKARAKSASASKQITEMIQGLNTSNALTAFDKMEEKVMALEAESESTLQLAAPDNLEQQFKALEGDSVDNELAAMKSGRSLKGGNGSKAQLPEGRPYDQVFKKDAIDEELDQLRRRTRE
jgi:phage shock protein A